MERRLIILILFYTGFVPLLQSVPRKYYLIHQTKNWSDAQAYCRAVHTDLAIVQNNKDLIRLQNEIQTEQVSSSAWMGLYKDINIWRWSMGNETVGSMKPWETAQHDHYNGSEYCGLLDNFDRFTGNQRYICIAVSKSWYDARVYCREHHTDLASSRDSFENSVIQGLITSKTWFGLFRDPVWKWTDQTNFSTLSWASGQPDNVLVYEYCGYLKMGQVADALCSDILPFFCYQNVTGKQQIAKVTVQSSENANNPAVKAAILEQIKRKLMEKENVTVTWREQSDGKVFHKKN